MKLVMTHRSARIELNEAVAWYETQRAGLGLDLLDAYEAVVDEISKDPAGGSPHTTPPFRYRQLKQFPYAVYYQELPDFVLIVSVPHHHRSAGYWEDRAASDL